MSDLGVKKYKWSMRTLGEREYIEVTESEIKTTFYIPAIRTIRTRAPFNTWKIIINSGQVDDDEEEFYFNSRAETEDFYYDFIYLMTGRITIREKKKEDNDEEN